MIFLAEIVRSGFNAASKLREFQVRLFGAEGNDPKAGLIDNVQSIEPLGLSSNPSVSTTLRTILVQLGNQMISLGTWNKTARPTDLAADEVRLHGLVKLAAAVRILATGQIRLDAFTGQDIVLNAGARKVAFDGGSVNGGTVSAVSTTLGGPINFVYTPVGGTPGAPTATLLLTGGKITSGADNVLV